MFDDPAFCCSGGPPSLTGTLNPYASAALYDGLSASLPSNDYLMHRSSSTHSFTPHHQAYIPVPDPTPAAFFPSTSPYSAHDLLEFHSDPVPRVFSSGDLQGMHCLQGSAESGMQEGPAAAAPERAAQYTAEERMKRIERYRSKRNQRNFQKKITYACRKTLADSRPRVRGRFARNGESVPEPEAEAETSEITYESYNNNNNETCTSNNNYYNGGNAGEWWRQMQAALVTTDEEDGSYDEDLWASFDGAFSTNLLS